MESLHIHWRNTDRSAALEEHLTRHAGKLERYHPKVQGGTVTVRKNVHDFTVHADFSVPGSELNVTHDHDDPYAAANLVFATLERSLKQDAQKRRGQVKRHDNTDT